jgi:hypothetical protein
MTPSLSTSGWGVDFRRLWRALNHPRRSNTDVALQNRVAKSGEVAKCGYAPPKLGFHVRLYRVAGAIHQIENGAMGELPAYSPTLARFDDLHRICDATWHARAQSNLDRACVLMNTCRMSITNKVLVQIFVSVCFCRVHDFPGFRPPRPWPTFPEQWLLFRLVV